MHTAKCSWEAGIGPVVKISRSPCWCWVLVSTLYLSLTPIGTKHTDLGTGLVYFKYDFGYEFGIITPNEAAAAGVASASRQASAPLGTAPAPSLSSAGPAHSFTLHSGDTQATVEPSPAKGGVTPTPAAQELDVAQLDDLVTSGRLRPESAFGTRTPPNVHISYPQTDAETSETEAEDGDSRLRGILRRGGEPQGGDSECRGVECTAWTGLGGGHSVCCRPPLLKRCPLVGNVITRLTGQFFDAPVLVPRPSNI